MGQSTSLAQRLDIVARSNAGHNDGAIAAELGLSPSTVRKWRRRAQRQGRPGLASSMGRPRRGALLRHATWIRECVLAWRQEHPGWGPKTLRAELQRDPRSKKARLPGRSTLGRFLREQGLTRVYRRPTGLAVPLRETPSAPHEEWEMDARGASRVPAIGMIALVHVNDRYSHARLLSYPFPVGNERVERHLNVGDYQLALRLAFTKWGLPQRLSVDHESVFIDNDSPSPFPTRFRLWLQSLGVTLVFSRVRRPTDQGMTERSHQLWEAQVLLGQRFASPDQLFQRLREREDFLNWDLGCASLAERPPLVAYPEAVHSGRPYRPEWEAELMRLERVDTFLSPGRWFRRVSKDGTISLGGTTYYAGVARAHQEVEVRFDAADRHWRIHADTGAEICRRPDRSITREALMGDLASIYGSPGFQPCLPFGWEAERAVRLCESFVGTT